MKLVKIITAIIAILKQTGLIKIKKMPMSKILELILNTAAPAAENIFAEKFAELLRKIKPVETRADLMKSMYVPIDTVLERYTKETKTKLDDAGVNALKKAIETVAAEDGIVLPNADND